MNVCGLKQTADRIDDEKEKQSFKTSICWISPADMRREPHRSCHHPVGGLGNYGDLLSPFASSNKPNSRAVQVAHNKNSLIVSESCLYSFYTEFHWVCHAPGLFAHCTFLSQVSLSECRCRPGWIPVAWIGKRWSQGIHLAVSGVHLEVIKLSDKSLLCMQTIDCLCMYYCSPVLGWEMHYA